MDPGVLCLLYGLPEELEVTYYEKQISFLFQNTDEDPFEDP